MYPSVYFAVAFLTRGTVAFLDSDVLTHTPGDLLATSLGWIGDLPDLCLPLGTLPVWTSRYLILLFI